MRNHNYTYYNSLGYVNLVHSDTPNVVADFTFGQITVRGLFDVRNPMARRWTIKTGHDGRRTEADRIKDLRETLARKHRPSHELLMKKVEQYGDYDPLEAISLGAAFYDCIDSTVIPFDNRTKTANRHWGRLLRQAGRNFEAFDE